MIFNTPLRSFLLCLGLVFFIGCGAVTRFDLGIPASKSESFFFHMKQAAHEAGHAAGLNPEKGTLTVRTRSGSLLYKANDYGDGLEVILSSKVHQNNREMEEGWLRNLEITHDELLERARVLAINNQDWN